jgi:hypothetical protein
MGSETAEVSAQKAPRGMAAAFVWLFWAGMLASAVTYVGLYGSREPYMDDWGVVPALTGTQPITLSWLWSQHNEHRLPLPRLLLVGLLQLGRLDFRVPMIFGVLARGTLASALIRLATRLRGRTAWTDIVFPLLLLHWGHSDNFLWAWQTQFTASTVLAGIALLLIATGGLEKSLARILALDLCLVALVLCGGNGLPFIPPLTLWLLVAAASCWPGARQESLAMLAGAVAAVALLAWYFVGLEPAAMPARPGFAGILRTFAEVLSLSLGLLVTADVYGLSNPHVLKLYWQALVILIVVLYAAASWLALRVCCRVRVERLRAFGLLMFLASMFGLGLGISWARSGFGEMSGLNRRYVTLMSPGVACIYLIFLLYGQGWSRRLQTLVVLSLAVLAWPSFSEGRKFAEGLRLKFSHLEEDIKSGLPPMILADRYTRFPVAIRPRHEEPLLALEMDQLRLLKVDGFASMQPDPPYRELAVDKVASEPRPNEYLLSSTRFAYAIRLKYRFEPPADKSFQVVPFHCSWLSIDSRTRQTVSHDFQATLIQDGNENYIHFWINEPIAGFRLLPGAACRIWDVMLLIPSS